MVNKNKVYTLTAAAVAAIYQAGVRCNNIAAIKEFRAATGADLKDAKDVIEGNFEQEIPVLKVGQKIRVSHNRGDWSYTGRIYETDGNEFKLIQDAVTCAGFKYNDIVVGYNRVYSANAVRDYGHKLEILPD